MDVTTELAVVMHVVRFGYDPYINNPSDFSGLFADLCCNSGFRKWILQVSSGLPEAAQSDPVGSQLDTYLQSKIHTYMGEKTPMWARYWHILLSVILSGSYQDYANYASSHGFLL